MRFIAIIFLLFGRAAYAQNPTVRPENPLAELKDQVQLALQAAQLPFTAEQERSIILMMEDRRTASEDLFGDLLNFAAGPTQGQESDRLRSAIAWMRSEFLARLQDYLTPDQLAAWNRSLELAATSTPESVQAPQRQQNQTQYVRINNNAFTAEDNSYRLFNRAQDRQNATATEVIQRGGVGAWHGNVEFLLKDDALNAGRRFATNKPPYQERQTSVNVGGPVIPDRLTSTFIFSQNEAKNSDTIRATLPDSIFSLGVTKPTTNRSLTINNTYQLANSTSLSFNGGYTQNIRRNQGVGGFVLPERAYTNDGTDWNLEVRQFTSLSGQSLFESRFKVSGNHDEIIPANSSPLINVLDAFNGGGSQNKVENTGRVYEFGNLYSRLGEKMTLKTGYNGIYRSNFAVNETNFGGVFTFSSLDAYRQRQPINYRATQGNTSLETTQFEMGFFAQNDMKLTPQVTLMYGARYEIQTNVRDPNNIDPRLSLAYAVGRATVIRAGAGIFHQRLLLDISESMRRLNGTHQYEIVIDNPSYPDPLQSGTIRTTFPSVRVVGEDVATPYSIVTLASIERTFLTNLFLGFQFDRVREVHRPRLRNINAPMDITSPTPASCKPGQTAATCVRPIPGQGNIMQLESSASETVKNVRINYRQRFSIFNLSGNYTFASTWLDANISGSFGNASVIGGYGPDGSVSDNYNIRADWGRILSPQHTWNGTVNARLPLGVFLTGTVNGNAHRHYTITTGKDDNQDTSANDRPPGRNRNGEVGPTFLAFNFNISKAFFFGSAQPQGGARTNVNLFANMTNAFNRPNYNPASGVMTSPNFGKYTSAADPREIEVGLRFQF